MEALGNTPLVKLNAIAADVKPTMLAKVEYFNPGNSIKDRIAWKLVADAEAKGLLKPGGTIVEGTSGNTGMGLALTAAVKGYRCIFTVTDKQSPEKISILRAVGAEVIVCPTNVAPEDPQSYYSVARRLGSEIPNAWYVNQYDNLSNRQAHYDATGPEIWAQTEGKITHLVAGMGTCGTITGIAQFLKEQNPDIKIIGVDTHGSVFKKLHETGIFDPNEVAPYLTEGIGEDFVPENLDMALVDKIIRVSDKDAALATRKLARLEGLFVGWSCGSAAHAALEYARGLKASDVVVVILPDHGSRYLGKVYNDLWMRDLGFLDEGMLSTAAEVLARKGQHDTLRTLAATDTLATAISVMRSCNFSQLPVVDAEGQVVGSLNENRVLNILVDDPAQRDTPVRGVMGEPFPFVLPSTRLDVISKLITRENPAVLVQLEGQQYDIITKQDLIQLLAG
jgi:cystathionine beta-synthase